MSTLHELVAGLNRIIDTDLSGDGNSINVKVFEERENLITQLTFLHSILPDLSTRVSAALERANDARSRELDTMDALLTKVHVRGDSEATTNTQVRGQSEAKIRARPNLYADRMTTVIASAGSMNTGSNTAGAVNTTTSNTVDADVDADADMDSEWTTVVRGRSKLAKKPKPIEDTPAQPQEVAKSNSVNFTEALSLNAINVALFSDVKQDGNLYYVTSADHFAFKINGFMFHGNIGMIYTDEKNPGKIKDCRFASMCSKQDKCEYYHDPLSFPGSRDHRNFIASSWLYAPPDSQYKNKMRSRRFGSREHLDMDIVQLTQEEVSRFYDQSMHDFLCAMLLKKNTV